MKYLGGNRISFDTRRRGPVQTQEQTGIWPHALIVSGKKLDLVRRPELPTGDKIDAGNKDTGSRHEPKTNQGVVAAPNQR
jgi:hypothetical protein